jgi:ABC-type amino acid transport substrate-binding protein
MNSSSRDIGRSSCRNPAVIFSLLVLVLLAAAPGAAHATTPLQVVYPRPESEHDSRYLYDWEVLRMALEKTRPRFGPYQLRQAGHYMAPARVTNEAAGAGPINLFVRATSAQLERQFRPVRIPIDRGLIGYRLLLVRHDDLPAFAKVGTLDQLRRFRIGQGRGWVDIEILQAAGFEVVEGNNYDGLFSMLSVGRFDALSRAVDEAWREYDERHEQIGFEVEPGIALYYPLARYFFTRRDAEGDLLARRLEAGLEAMVQDGSLQALFWRHKGPLIKRSGLAQRRLFRIPNPELPPQTPLARSELWYRPQERAGNR